MGLESFRVPSVEQTPKQDTVDSLLNEFPEELQDRLEMQVAGMEEQVARDYLIDKLTLRSETLTKSFEDIAPGIEIAKRIPESFRSAVQESVSNEGLFLGEGKIARVYQTAGEDGVCYKILRNEIVRQLHKKIVREGIIQNNVAKLLNVRSDCARTPEVYFLADDLEMQVLMMERVKGSSLKDVFAGMAELPPQFDIETCFAKIERSIEEMHLAGYFHRDLTNNSGNIMIDTNGDPWIIDFGSAIRSINSEGGTNSFQLHVNGTRFLSSDLDAVRTMKNRLHEYMRKTGQEHE